jgi:hypothetical protein
MFKREESLVNCYIRQLRYTYIMENMFLVWSFVLFEHFATNKSH